MHLSALEGPGKLPLVADHGSTNCLSEKAGNAYWRKHLNFKEQYFYQLVESNSCKITNLVTELEQWPTHLESYLSSYLDPIRGMWSCQNPSDLPTSKPNGALLSLSWSTSTQYLILLTSPSSWEVPCFGFHYAKLSCFSALSNFILSLHARTYFFEHFWNVHVS